MRQIKFRIWHKETQHFFYSSDRPFFWENDLGNGMHVKRADAHVSGRLCRFFNIFDADMETIQQFTGLKDKNGREVYEGDIVTFSTHGYPHEKYREDNCGGEVWYNEEEAMFCFGKFVQPEEVGLFNLIRPGYTWWYSMADNVDSSTLEVTGNIYENKA